MNLRIPNRCHRDESLPVSGGAFIIRRGLQEGHCISAKGDRIGWTFF
jgi:hypothetical protein